MNYANILNCFKRLMKEKRPHLEKKKVFFHQDIANMQIWVVAKVNFYESGDMNCFLIHYICQI